MTWIKTAPVETDGELEKSINACMHLYPKEYAEPVHSLADHQNEGPAIIMAHSLIPEALKHAFSTFGALMSPELPLTRREHEMIAATVSTLNDCFY